MPETEQPIIRGCVAGNRTSQQELYDLFAPKLMNVCARYAKNKDESEEIMQDGFYRIFKNIQQYNFSGSFEGWMRKIIVNTAIQRYKSTSKLHMLVPIQHEHNQIPDQIDIYSRIEANQMIQLVQQLPTRCRMVFNLYAFEGYKHREIAQILGITEGTSKSNLYDARMILKKALLLINNYHLKMVK